MQNHSRVCMPILQDRLREVVPTSLYVHIPFCKSRCFYCDFNTYVTPEHVMEMYLVLLEEELKMISQEATEPLETVFFGGGTPTLFSTLQLTRLLEMVHKYFTIRDTAEMTMEANPGSVNKEKLQALFTLGVNRLSFGGQSFSDRLLLTIGRLHDVHTIYRSIAMAQEAGFQRLNLDLMFGLPEQTMEDVKRSIEEAMALDIEHISTYWLKVESGTPFATWQEQGRLPLPGEDEEADMYDWIRSCLTDAGYTHYEISNFAKPGAESRHNLVYWRNEPYFAAGAGAHGYVHGQRYENERSINVYQNKIQQSLRPIAEHCSISHHVAMEDTMMLGLRLREGVSKHRFADRHGLNIMDVFGSEIESLCEQKLLVWQGDSLRMTEQAWPIANVVFAKFIESDRVDA